jgi:predicted nicotinamide N-methyase
MNRSGRWIESAIRSPLERPGDWVTDVYLFGGREIRLTRPRDPDGLLDDPAVQRQSRASDYMPYWAYVWPGAILLANYVAAERWEPDTRAVEIGCGLGLAGLAALAVGLAVTFTDYSPAALELAEYNARRNGFDRFDTRLVDWSNPPHERFDVVLGADVLYEPRCLPDVLRVLDAMLAPGGVALLSDPDRAVADAFPQMGRERGYAVPSERVRAQSANGRVLSGRVFRVTRRTAAE